MTKASHILRQLAHNLEDIKSDETLKDKEVWDLINEIQDKLLEIINSDKLFND